MNEIRVEEDRLGRGVGEFESYIQRFSSCWRAMESSIEELNTTWKGPAHTAFVESFQKDRELMDEVWNILADMQAAMEYAGSSYRQCDSEVNAVVAAVSAGV